MDRFQRKTIGGDWGLGKTVPTTRSRPGVNIRRKRCRRLSTFHNHSLQAQPSRPAPAFNSVEGVSEAALRIYRWRR